MKFNQEQLAVIYDLVNKEKKRISPMVITDNVCPSRRPEDAYKALVSIINLYKNSEDK